MIAYKYSRCGFCITACGRDLPFPPGQVEMHLNTNLRASNQYGFFRIYPHFEADEKLKNTDD